MRWSVLILLEKFGESNFFTFSSFILQFKKRLPSTYTIINSSGYSWKMLKLKYFSIVMHHLLNIVMHRLFNIVTMNVSTFKMNSKPDYYFWTCIIVKDTSYNNLNRFIVVFLLTYFDRQVKKTLMRKKDELPF